MNRLIKAEWYRVRHSSGLIKWLVIVCLLCVAFLFGGDLEIYKYNLTENLRIAQESMMMSINLLPIFTAVIVGISYMNKTAYYEVMAGNKISHILFSKVLVNATLVAVAVSLSLWTYWTIIGINNGIGEIRQLPIRGILLFIVFFHISASGILITTSVRHITGGVLTYLRFFVFEMLILMILQLNQDSLSGEMSERIIDWFTMIKTTKILNGEYAVTHHLVFTVIAGMLVETGVWFTVSYLGMKKKLYK